VYLCKSLGNYFPPQKVKGGANKNGHELRLLELGVRSHGALEPWCFGGCGSPTRRLQIIWIYWHFSSISVVSPCHMFIPIPLALSANCHHFGLMAKWTWNVKRCSFLGSYLCVLVFGSSSSYWAAGFGGLRAFGGSPPPGTTLLRFWYSFRFTFGS